MNPSGNGWIKKYFSVTTSKSTLLTNGLLPFYESFRGAGFVYGTSVLCVDTAFDVYKFTPEEITKVNLLAALSNVFFDAHPELTEQDFYKHTLNFYQTLEKEEISFFGELFTGKNNDAQLEKIIAKRVLSDGNIITKNFSSVLTNTLLFIDVLAFQKYISDSNFNCKTYIVNLETVLEKVVITTIKNKKEASKYDKQLLKLFESSLRYHVHPDSPKLKDTGYLELLTSSIEKQYLIDIACMTVWDDENLEISEIDYIHDLGSKLAMDKKQINSSILYVYEFYKLHKKELPYLNDPNPVKNFYDNSSRMVINLITRNSKRLIQELADSKELVILLSQSTVRSLNKEEKQKVKEQLLDVCKSIPSLAIFMLPGGSILLPLLIKFIPKLLPSAFDDNRIK